MHAIRNRHREREASKSVPGLSHHKKRVDEQRKNCFRNLWPRV